MAALPWIVIPVVALIRARGWRTLEEESEIPPADPPPVSVIVPARNESRNIERCSRSILATTYPALDLIVVDDCSEDDTRQIMARIAQEDSRARLISLNALPPGWFGKQWACARGATAAGGAILCFADADTEHAPSLVARAVNAMLARDSALLSIVGRQELRTFWERVIQPQIFGLMLVRYGSTEIINRSARERDKIANGQCMLIRRDAYDRVGGHAGVREKVTEDLALAQRVFRTGMRQELLLGHSHLSTRMYTSLGEIVRGWSKNLYMGALEATPGPPFMRTFLPLVMLAPSLMMLVPCVALLAWALELLSGSVAVWAAICLLAVLVWWMGIYRAVGRISPLYALTFPLGAAILLWIALRSLARGRRVEWKGREYYSG